MRWAPGSAMRRACMDTMTDSPAQPPNAARGLPSDFPVASAVAALDRLCKAAQLPADSARVRRAVTEAFATGPGTAEESPATRLTLAARQLGLHLRRTTQTPHDALQHLGRSPLVVPLDGWGHASRWMVLTAGSRPGNVLLYDAAHQAIERPRAAVQAALEAVLGSGDAEWLSGEAALPLRRASTADAVGHADPHLQTHVHAHAAGHSGPGHPHHPHLPPLRRLYRVLRPESSDIGVITVFALTIGVLSLAVPVAVEALVNTVAFGGLGQPLLVISLMLFTFLGFQAILRSLQTYVAELLQRRIFVRVVADLSHRLPRAQTTALDAHHGPELMNRFFEVMTVQKSAALLVLDGIAVVLQALVGMVVLAFYHPFLLGFDVFLLACLAVIVFGLGHGAVDTSIQESRAKYAVAAWLEELARHPILFKGAGGYDSAVDRADRLTIEYLLARKGHFRIVWRQVVFAFALQAVASTLLLGVGGWLVIDGQLTLGQLVASELIVTVLVGSLTKLGKHMESFYDLLAAVDKLGHLFDLPIERQTGESFTREPRGATVRAIDLRVAGFGGRADLRPFDLAIAPGEIVALVGPAGSGKSRLLDVIFALRSPVGGRLEIDGIDIRSVQPAALREVTTLIRDVEIFTGTIAENVHLDRGDITLRDVRHALQETGLYDELVRFPQGIDTPLQTGGPPLTETQARRLILARALAARPRLLLIDGLLDGLTDEQIEQALGVLRSHRERMTVLVTTGRRRVAAGCDRLIELAPDPVSDAAGAWEPAEPSAAP